MNEQVIGNGFGGTVYRSLHIPSGKIVARKILGNRIPSQRLLKSMSAEIETLKSCDSPYILRCYGYIQCSNSKNLSLILEYMDMGSLDQVMGPARTPLNPVHVSVIAHHILQGITYLHESMNILHRDVKPSNILLNSNGDVKICDFGESIQLVGSATRSIVGTTGYMAPERIRGDPYDVKADIWSLGITVIELVTGVFPFNLETDQRSAMVPNSLKNDYSTGEESALVELWETINNDPSPKLDIKYFSEDLVSFVEVCLMRDPNDRPDLRSLCKHPFVQINKEILESFKRWAREARPNYSTDLP